MLDVLITDALSGVGKRLKEILDNDPRFKVMTLISDVRRYDDLAAEIFDKFTGCCNQNEVRKFDAVINTGYIEIKFTLDEFNDNKWNSVFNCNAMGVLNVFRATARYLKAAKLEPFFITLIGEPTIAEADEFAINVASKTAIAIIDCLGHANPNINFVAVPCENKPANKAIEQEVALLIYGELVKQTTEEKEHECCQ